MSVPRITRGRAPSHAPRGYLIGAGQWAPEAEATVKIRASTIHSRDGALRLSQFHTLASSSAYLEALLERYRSAPADVPEDWRAAFEILADYFPGAVSPGPESGSSAHELVRRFAHLAAQLDPLERELPQPWQRLRVEFEQRLARMGADRTAPALAALLKVYAGSLALETGHLDDPARVAWIESRRENSGAPENAARSRALAAVVKAETFEKFMAIDRKSVV